MEKTLNPAPAPHADAARVLLEKIRSLQLEVPRMTTLAPEQTQRLSAAGRLPDVAIESATVQIERSSRLAIAANADAPSVRDAYAYSLAFGQVPKELRALARMIEHSVRVERARAGLAALDIYAHARRMSEREDGAELIPFVEDMKQILKKRKARKTNSSPDSAPLVPSARSTK
ncbi:MAG TPA: hypothetical protein VE974_02315 [Thermoanaerobaculia bacterium]|nr:hypothetical protein [Thermoanaerobaculia bacterium]